MDTSPGADDLVLVGRVAGAHGIRGGLRIHSYAESMDFFQKGAAIQVVLPDGKMNTMTIEWASPHGRGVRMGLASVDDRDRAERLVGSSLYVQRDRLPVLEEDTYYWHELIGLDVYDTNGSVMGRLDQVIPTSANDVYVVHGDTDGGRREILIPAIAKVVRDIDLERGIMVVDPPEGL